MEEYNSFMKNGVWEVVLRPEGKSVVTSKCLYKINHVADGNIKKYKDQFVARGFSQVEGVDYDETFVSVARFFFDQSSDLHCCRDGEEDSLDGCEDRFSQWSSTRGGLFGVGTGL